LGIPAAALIHEAFADAAVATADVSGMAGYEFVIVPYPVAPHGEWTDEEVDMVAAQVAPRVARLLSSDAAVE
jgi:hypothetical protein